MKAEQETIIRWDRESNHISLYTASPIEAARWRKKGYNVKPVSFHGKDATGWEAEGPPRCITIRRLVNGKIPTRSGGFSRERPSPREGVLLPLRQPQGLYSSD